MDGKDSLHFLQGIVRDARLVKSLDDGFRFIWKRVVALMPCDRIDIAFLDETSGKLGFVEIGPGGLVWPAQRTLECDLEPFASEPGPIIFDDLRDYAVRNSKVECMRPILEQGMMSAVAMRLLADERPIGVMIVSSRTLRAYRPEHEEGIQEVAEKAAFIVERSRLMAELWEKSEYLENVLQSSADAIVAMDADNVVRTWNEGAQRMFGYEPEEVIGRDSSMLIPSDRRKSEEELWIRQTVERAGYLKDHECERLAKGGRRLMVHMTCTLLRDKSGHPVGRSAIMRDVTHVKRLQEELVQSRSLAAVGELAATVAHEIKNPLAGISGAIQVLADAISADDYRRPVVGEILDQIRRLDGTVRDLLEFARPAVPARCEMDLGEAIRQAWSLVAKQPEALGVRFSFDGPLGVRVAADPHLLQQVWINLFQNAVEAMPRGGDLRVVVIEGASVRVEVRDTGCGVEAANAGKVFRPFFSTKVRGTGLGLAITRKIVEAHGGTIRLEGVPGHGARVFVEIPK